LAVQTRLVALDRQDPVRAALMQVVDVAALGVQRIGGHHHPGQGDAGPRDGIEQRRERGDLAGLAIDVDLTQHGAAVVVEHRQQMPGTAGLIGRRVPRAAQGLAVHRDGTPDPAGAGTILGSRQFSGDPAADGLVEPVTVHAAQHPADRRLTRRTRPDPQRVAGLFRQVSGPLADRDHRPRPGHHSAHRHRQHRHQPMPYTPTSPRIDHGRQHRQQPRSSDHRIHHRQRARLGIQDRDQR